MIEYLLSTHFVIGTLYLLLFYKIIRLLIMYESFWIVDYRSSVFVLNKYARDLITIIYSTLNQYFSNPFMLCTITVEIVRVHFTFGNDRYKLTVRFLLKNFRYFILFVRPIAIVLRGILTKKFVKKHT